MPSPKIAVDWLVQFFFLFSTFHYSTFACLDSCKILTLRVFKTSIFDSSNKGIVSYKSLYIFILNWLTFLSLISSSVPVRWKDCKCWFKVSDLLDGLIDFVNINRLQTSSSSLEISSYMNCVNFLSGVFYRPHSRLYVCIILSWHPIFLECMQ